MSFSYDSDHFSGGRKASAPKIEVDVIIDEKDQDHLIVRSDEGSRQVTLPRRGVRITSDQKIGYVTIKLSENQAIAYGLV